MSNILAFLQPGKKGYSLLELAFVLMFAAVIVGAAVYTYTNVAAQHRTTNFMAQHSMLVAKIHAYFMEKAPSTYITDGSGASANIRPVLYDRLVIPQTIGDKGTLMASGKLCCVIAYIVNNQQIWSLKYTNIDATSCITLLTATVGINNPNTAIAQKLYQLDTDASTGFFTIAKRGTNYTRQNISDACASPQNNVRLAYIFG